MDLRAGRVLMLANARVLGYVFNPITVYWCHAPNGELACIVAEVHNTYGGRHRYLLRPDSAGRAETAKAFYVSPFFAVEGGYRMRFGEPGSKLNVAIALWQDGQPVFTATLRGARRSASAGAVLRTALRRPLMPQRISALIFRHGVALWLRRLPVIPRKPPTSQKEVL